MYRGLQRGSPKPHGRLKRLQGEQRAGKPSKNVPGETEDQGQRLNKRKNQNVLEMEGEGRGS